MKTRYKIGLAIGVALIALAFITHETPQQKEARYIRRGNALFEKGEYKKARLEYKNAAKIMPADAEIPYRWGLVDEAEGDIRNAYLDYQQALEQDPHFNPALLKIAHYLLVTNDVLSAQSRVDAVLANEPDNAEAHAMQGALLLRKKDYPGTEKEARFALSKDPANITAASVLAGMYLAQGDISKAAGAVDDGIAHNPGDLSLLTLKARLYETPLNLPKIDEAYQAIFKSRPKDTEFRLLLANTYLGAHKIDEAEAVLRQAVIAIPDDWALKHELVLFLNTHRNLEAAEKEVRGYMQAYPKNISLNFWLADLYITHNQTDKAVKLLENIASKDETDQQSLNAQTSLARIHFAQGDKELAQKIVAAVLKKSPTNHTALYIRANIAADQGRFQNAVSDLRLILRDQPKAKDALQLLGEVLLKQGYTDLAIETLNQLIDADPANPAVRVRLAQMYNLNGDPDRALDMLKGVTTAAPGYAVGWENLARVAIDMKDFDTAKAAIHSLDGIEGQHMTATFLEGQIAAPAGKYTDAIASYTKVIDADPSSPLAAHALYALATGYHNKQELEKNTDYIASLKTDNAYVSTVLGECYSQLGKKDLAAAAFDKAIANNSTSQDAFINRAKIYLIDNKPEDALAVLKKGTLAVPGDIRAPMMQADILSSLGRYDESIALYESILNNNPAADVAANNLAAAIADHAYTDQGKLDKALELAKKFAATSNPSQLDTLGWIYYRQGKLDKAQMILARAIASDDKPVPEFYYHYGVILLKAGQAEQAKTALQQAVDTKGANYPDLEIAKKMLASLK